MRNIILLHFLIQSGLALSQQSARLEVNNIRIDVASNGSIGIGNNANGMEFPKNSGIHALFGGNLWIAGFDSSFGVLHVSANAYNEASSNYRPGPIASDYSSTFLSKYDRVWKVSKSDIDYHKAHFTDAGYTILPAIADWPGNGNTGNGESLILAPFFDKNLNSTYEPYNGDYPLINGDEALYVILNDEQGVPQKTDGNSFHAEMHLMVYAFDAIAQPHLHNSIFLHYKIINRSNEIYNDVLVGHWNDFDLGCFSNDRVGTDTNLNSIFVYNGSESDNPCNGVPGYENLPVSLGLTFLNRDLFSSSYFTNGAPPFMSDPGNNPMEIYNYMNGYWRDGTPFTEGGNGYGGLVPTHFMFPGEPCDSSDDSEVPSVPFGDRRALASTGYFKWNPMSEICIDAAYTFSVGDSLPTCIYNDVSTLKGEIQKVKNFYSQNLNYCDNILSNTKEESNADSFIGIMYNPGTKQIKVNSHNQVELGQFAIYNIEGKKMLHLSQVMNDKPIDLVEMPNGFYIAEVSILNHSYFQKIVIF